MSILDSKHDAEEAGGNSTTPDGKKKADYVSSGGQSYGGNENTGNQNQDYPGQGQQNVGQNDQHHDHKETVTLPTDKKYRGSQDDHSTSENKAHKEDKDSHHGEHSSGIRANMNSVLVIFIAIASFSFVKP